MLTKQLVRKWILRKAKKLSLLSLVLLAGALVYGSFSLSRLSTQYSMRQFLPKSHPLMEADDAVKAMFGLGELEPYFALLELKEGESWLGEARAERLMKVSERIAKEAGVKRVLHFANVEGASGSGRQLNIGRLFTLTAPEKREERYLKDPLLAPNLISPDSRRMLFLVSTEELSTQRSAELISMTRHELEREFPESRVFMGGIPAVQNEMTSILSRELKNFLLLSLLASFAMLLLFFRTWQSVLVPLVIMAAANVAALVGMALSGVAFTVLSTTLPVLVSITVISMATHTMLRFASDYDLERRVHGNPNKLLVLYRSFKGLLLPNFLTAITTAVGFFAIAFTKIPLIREYGLSVGVAVFVAWMSIMCMLPPLLVLFPVPIARRWTGDRARWALWISSYKRELFIGILSVCAFFLWAGKDLNWSARLFDDLPEGQEARRTTELVDAKLGGMIPFDIVITAKEDNAWNDPSLIRALDALAGHFRGQPSIVGSVSSLADFQRAASRMQGKEFPETRAAAAEINFLYGFAEENPVANYLTPEGRSVRMNLRLHDIPADRMERFVGAAASMAERSFPGFEVRTAGMATTVHALNNDLCHELIFGFWQALALIAVLLLLVFRSWRWTLIAVIPNLVTPAVLLGVLALLKTPIKPGIALIFSIALGIAFDNTVYLLGRLRLIGKGREMPVAKAWWQEGNLCLFSSLAIGIGFCVFLVSYFSLNRSFGAYMLVSLFGGLVGDLVLLPVLLMLFPKFPQKKKKENVMKPSTTVAAGFAFLLGASLAYASTIDPNNADQILDQVEKNVKSRDEVADLTMTIIEANGAKKERQVKISRKGEEKHQKVLVRLASPADLKGTALLSVKEGDNSDQWLYLPSSKQTRRILSSKKSSSFMDSELSYEDMGANTKFKSKVLRQEDIGGHKFAVIESVPGAGDSSYSKILTWVALDTYLVGKMEYYDQNQKLLKVSLFSGYKRFDGVWRAQKIHVQNMQNKRGTDLVLSKLNLNKGLDDAEFTESSLSDSD